MGLTDFERARLRGLWRSLSRAATASDPDALAGCADVLNWASPIEAKGGAFALFALGRLAHGFVKSGTGARQQMAPALALLGELAADLLDATDPAVRAPPQLPFRKDLDG